MSELGAHARLDGNFRDRAGGNFGSADLGGVMRERGGGAVQGGTTRFETVQGRLRAADGQARVEIRRLDAGGLDAAGTLVFPVDGSLQGAGYRLCAGRRSYAFSMPIDVSGSVAAPALRLEPEVWAGPGAAGAVVGQ